MKKLLFALLVAAACSLRADDLTTVDGKQYIGVTISRAEPDGVVVVTDSGIEKIPFTKLGADIQKKYGYNPAAAAKFAAEVEAAQRERRARTLAILAKQNKITAATAENAAARKKLDDASARLDSIAIWAVIRPYYFRDSSTAVYVQPYKFAATGEVVPQALNFVAVKDWIVDGDEFNGEIDEKMPETMEAKSWAVVKLYRIGHTADSSREPLFTTIKEKAFKYLVSQSDQTTAQ